MFGDTARKISILVILYPILVASTADAAEFPMLEKERGVMTMAPLLERTTPAVVNISVRTKLPANENPLLRDPFFRRFFDIPERMPERDVLSAGSAAAAAQIARTSRNMTSASGVSHDPTSATSITVAGTTDA